jgi:hypothetical protein
MQKFTPPPAQLEPLEIDAVLKQLYRRRAIVRRLIRSLELYSTIQSRHKTHVPVLAAGISNRHVN